MAITHAGRELARHLHVVVTDDYSVGDAFEVCSRIHRAGVTYARIQEVWCSVELSAPLIRWYEKREAQLEALITRHCATLTEMTGHEYTPDFSGDPRGYVVHIKSPGVELGNQDWSLDGRTGVA